MLSSLHKGYRVMGSRAPANTDQLSQLQKRYPSIPDEYLNFLREATEVELQYVNGQYLRIWEPAGCIEMDDAYNISKRIDDAIPIGDDGGSRVIFYHDGKEGFGLYHVGYGDLDADDAVFAAPSLSSLLQQAVGVDTF